MSPEAQAPPPPEVERFLQQLRLRRQRLSELAGEGLTPELVRAVDEVGEDLLVADEELRVQAEQLEHTTRHVDALVSAYEELFADSPVAYVHTDADGLVLRLNRAAAQLLGIPPSSKRSRTLTGTVRSTDRPALRDALSRLRAPADRPAVTRTDESIEAAIVRPDGAEVPVLLSGRRTREAETGAPTVHWEIRERAVSAATPSPTAERAAVPAIALLGRASARLGRAEDPAALVAAIVEEARRLVPAADGAAVATFRRGGRTAATAATSDVAAQVDATQFELDEGPTISSMSAGSAVLVADLGREERWPRFARAVVPLGVRSLIGVPLLSARGTVGTLTLYAHTPASFHADDAVLGAAFAAQAGAVHTLLEINANLRIAMETREAVGQAVGVLMERHRLPATAAFDRLVAASQQTHHKLRDVAIRVVETGEDP